MYFLSNLSHCVKSYGYFCQVLVLFTIANSLNMVMSCDPISKFRKVNCYVFLIVHLILGKVTKVLVEKLSTSEGISQKPY